MKNPFLILFLLLLLCTVGHPDYDESMYDQRWEIIIIDCQGNTTIYNNCAITNQGESVVSFIPNAGRVGDPRGRAIRVFLRSCTQVIMQEEL
jgi:hypothetical protein